MLLASFANPDTIFYQESQLSRLFQRNFALIYSYMTSCTARWITLDFPPPPRAAGRPGSCPCRKKTCVSDMILLLHSTRPPKRRVRHFKVDFPICGKFRIQCASRKSTQRPKLYPGSKLGRRGQRHKECTQRLIWAIRKSAQSAQ